jgi:hypothetical protein
MRLTGFLRALVAACSALLAAQCVPFFGPDCIDETRGLSVSARLMATGSPTVPRDTGELFLGLLEARNHRSKRTSYRHVTWLVGSGVPRSTVTAVHVHEKVTDRILFDVPVDSAFWPAYIVTRTINPVAYTGPLSWNDFYDRLGNGSVYVDVHTSATVGGSLRGEPSPLYPNWREFTHSYCS